MECSDLTLSDLIFMDEEQCRDPAMRTLIDDPSRGTPTSSPRFYGLCNGCLCPRNSRPWLIVAPKHIPKSILSELHEAPASGHLGIIRTYARIKERFH